MNFNISHVERDIVPLKKMVLADNDPHGYKQSTTFLGLGYQGGVVSGYGSAAVKHTEEHIVTDALGGTNYYDRAAKLVGHRMLEEYKRLSTLAMNRGIHCAPYLDTTTREDDKKRHHYAFMPKLDGITSKSEGAIEKMLAIGTDGLKTFFKDYLAVHELGFVTDIATKADNLIVTDKNINMIDMIVAYKGQQKLAPETQQCAYYFAVDTILGHWQRELLKPKGKTKSEFEKNKNEIHQKRKMLVELAGNVESVLKWISNSSKARTTAKHIRKCDFSQDITLL